METAHDLGQHLKLTPKHEHTLIILGAVAGIVGLMLLLLRSGPKAATTADAGAAAGIGSSGNAYAASLPFGTSQDTLDILRLLEMAANTPDPGLSNAGAVTTPPITAAAPITTAPTPITPAAPAAPVNIVNIFADLNPKAPVVNGPVQFPVTPAAPVIDRSHPPIIGHPAAPVAAPPLAAAPPLSSDGGTHLFLPGFTTYQRPNGGIPMGTVLPAMPIMLAPPVGITASEPSHAPPITGPVSHPGTWIPGQMVPGGGAAPANKYGLGGTLVRSGDYEPLPSKISIMAPPRVRF